MNDIFNCVIGIFLFICILSLILLIGITTMFRMKYNFSNEFLNNCMCCCSSGDCVCSDTYYDVELGKCVIGPAGLRTFEEPVNNLSNCQWEVVV